MNLFNMELNSLEFLLIIIIMIMLFNHLGVFTSIHYGFKKLYFEILHKESPKQERVETIVLARDSLEILQESQKLVLLELPFKLDEVTDELHDIGEEMVSLVAIIGALVKHMRHTNERR